jgi:Lrp/AsnC family transcriptional regulator
MRERRLVDNSNPNLDDIDLRILDALQKDSSLSTSDLAELVGLSQSPCWRRLSRLKEAGYIRAQVTLLNAQKLGLDTMVFASVRLSAHGRANLTEFSEAIRRFPEVVECHAIMGTFDFLLRIVTRDIRAYEQFLFSRLSTLSTVQEINSTMALSEIKFTTALPLRAR